MLKASGRERFDPRSVDPLEDPSWQAISAEVEREENMVNFFGVRESLKPNERALLAKIENFLLELSLDFQKELSRILEEHSKENFNLSKKILAFLREGKINLPTFKIYPPAALEKVLVEQNIPGERLQEPYPGDFLVIFNLPKPLARFWFKGFPGEAEIRGTAIEWGKIYMAVLPTVWRAIDLEAEKRGLVFNRVNNFGVHDPKDFYYIWSVGRQYD